MFLLFSCVWLFVVDDWSVQFGQHLNASGKYPG